MQLSLCSKDGSWILIWSPALHRLITTFMFCLIIIGRLLKICRSHLRITTFMFDHNWETSKNLPIIFQEEILVAINTLQRSPVYGHDTDFTALLGLFNCHSQNWSKMSFICPPTPVRFITKRDTIFPFLT